MLNILLGMFLIAGWNGSQDTLVSPKEIPIFSTLAQNQILTLHPDFTYTHVIERTILVASADGLGHAFTRMFYDKLNEARDFELEMSDALTGKTLKRARLKDMGDAASYSSSTVFDDNRYKYYELTAGRFPVKVKIRTEELSKSNFFLPRWEAVPHYNQKVTQSTLTVNYPTELGLSFKELNLSGNRKQSELGGITSITWTENDLAVQAKGFDVDEDPRLLLAPVKFALDHYKGEMNDWSGLASWQYMLNKGRDTLPEDFRAKILKLVEGVDEPYEKIKILYAYLQKNFRYVSIQLGIGGWQTMTAEDVVKYAYGDCKGLTNLMKAMLEVAGIPSNYTLVFAGSKAKDIEVDLPSNQFNHVILQVPTDANPIWLECTSTTLPAGFLGEFTKDRHVLVTKPDGGYLTKTPSYDSEEWNLIQSQSKVVVDAQGNAKINSRKQFFGNFAEEILYVKNILDERQQRDYLNRNSAVSGLVVEGYQIDIVNQDSLLNAELTFDGFVQKFSQATAKRVVLKSFIGKLGPDHLVNKSLRQVDEYEIELPADWKPEGEIPRVALDEANVSGFLHISYEGTTLRVRRELSLQIPEELEKEDQTDLLRKINTSFDRTILLTKSALATTPSL